MDVFFFSHSKHVEGPTKNGFRQEPKAELFLDGCEHRAKSLAFTPAKVAGQEWCFYLSIYLIRLGNCSGVKD